MCIYISESKKYFFEIKLVSKDDMSAKKCRNKNFVTVHVTIFHISLIPLNLKFYVIV